MPKRKVIYIIHQLNYGGVQKSILTALDAIDYSENEVTLYVRKNRIDLIGSVNKNVSDIIVNDYPGHYYRKPYAAWLSLLLKIYGLLHIDISRIKKKLDKYIIECHMNYEKKKYFSDGKKYDVAISYIQGYNALFTDRCVNADRKIMFYHGSTDETHEIHEEVFPHFDKIVGVNSGVRDVLKGLYPDFADKITYLENYVDADTVRKKSEEFTVDAPSGKTVLCTCGRFTKVKGFDIAVDAAKILKVKGIPFVWYFVGDGPERKALIKQISENGLKDDIIITGMKDNPYPYIKACDIYIQPSREESYGLTIAEAIALSRPVISTNTVGGLLLLNDGLYGLLADISSVSIADKTEELMLDKALRDSIISRIDKTDWSAECERYKADWKELLKG